MSTCTPHFLLFSEARPPVEGDETGRWHFVLESLADGDSLEAAEEVPAVSAEQLELLAVVRGLEALDQPSRVTLVTTSRYVARGLRNGLSHWRENDFQWERFGRLVPVKHGDLWRRIDRALGFHRLDCRLWNIDGAPAVAAPEMAQPEQTEDPTCSRFAPPAAACRKAARLATGYLRRWISGAPATPAAAAA